MIDEIYWNVPLSANCYMIENYAKVDREAKFKNILPLPCRDYSLQVQEVIF